MDKLLGLNRADFGTTGLTLYHLIGAAFNEPERAVQRGRTFGRGGGLETMQAWRLRAVCAVLEAHGVDLNRPVEGGQTADEYLIWSNDASSWWKPNGAGYTANIYQAGRYTLHEARERAGRRSWPATMPIPPEVVVQAPSAMMLASAGLGAAMNDLVRAANADAVRTRREAAAS